MQGYFMARPNKQIQCTQMTAIIRIIYSDIKMFHTQSNRISMLKYDKIFHWIYCGF